ncbi:MAG: citrate (Si)-synthase, eukaryotic [Candidatus Marinimicrobia bacterium]|nr:citrate (Si)-synthase, eukaryotic [Candidatus Neomarinimicrobiota bacterium]
MNLKNKFEAKIGPMRDKVKNLVKEHGDFVVSEVNIQQLFGGTRGVKSLICDTSDLDPYDGIKFRGFSIPELREKLPSAKDGEQPLPEGLFYLLLTGDLPTEDDVKLVSDEWKQRQKLPDYLLKIMDSYPKDLHPMTQFSSAILALEKDSIFAKKYSTGISKYELWDPMYEDVMNLLAKLPSIASYIYRRTYKDGKRIMPDDNLDWGANFAHMMGVEKPDYKELMRIYLVIHSDHEGGNVSAHTAKLVNSALASPYYSFSAAMNGLAGPLHGLANQAVISWIMDVKQQLGGGVPTKEQLKKFLWDTLKSGRVVPGYGHAVLRKTDPRYMAQRDFALKHLPDDEIFKIVSMLYDVTPDILREHGKAKNPWPNVDAHSGCLQVHYGVTEYNFYTVMFGVGRALGILSQILWARTIGRAIERPGSVTTDWLVEQVNKKN